MPLYVCLFIRNYSSLNISVDKYLSPVSGSRTTIVLPAFSFLCAITVAALTAAPLEMPTNKPSFLANVLPVLKASSLETVIISS